MVEISWQYTEPDFLDSQLAAGRLVPRVRRQLRVLLLMGIVLLVAVAVVFATNGPEMLEDARPWGGAALGVYFILAATVIRRYSIKRSFRKNQHLRGEFSARFTEDGLTFVGPESRAEMKWSSFDDFAESDRTLILFRQPTILQSFPKSAFALAQLTEVRALLTEKVQKKK